jgi:hypothetical protein
MNNCRGPGCKDLEDKTFIRAKRAMMCADCAYALRRTLHLSPKPESTKDILLKLQDTMIQDVNAMVQVPSSHTFNTRRSAWRPARC